MLSYFFITSEAAEGVIVAKSFDDAVEAVSSDKVQDRLENVFVIGGSSVYKVRKKTYFYDLYL